MVKKKNNIVIPKNLTQEEIAIHTNVIAIKEKLQDKNVWADFSKNVLLGKNKVELIQEFFGCTKEVAEYIMTLSLFDLQSTPESLEGERQLLQEGKAYL